MSTTPMQRPFLVGTVMTGASPDRHDSGNGQRADRGLYLVPALNRGKKRQNPFHADFYKLAAVAAALFLVLTI